MPVSQVGKFVFTRSCAQTSGQKLAPQLSSTRWPKNQKQLFYSQLAARSQLTRTHTSEILAARSCICTQNHTNFPTCPVSTYRKFIIIIIIIVIGTVSNVKNYSIVHVMMKIKLQVLFSLYLQCQRKALNQAVLCVATGFYCILGRKVFRTGQQSLKIIKKNALREV